jgi:hypothetical protein
MGSDVIGHVRDLAPPIVAGGKISPPSDYQSQGCALEAAGAHHEPLANKKRQSPRLKVEGEHRLPRTIQICDSDNLGRGRGR